MIRQDICMSRTEVLFFFLRKGIALGWGVYVGD